MLKPVLLTARVFSHFCCLSCFISLPRTVEITGNSQVEHSVPTCLLREQSFRIWQPFWVPIKLIGRYFKPFMCSDVMLQRYWCVTGASWAPHCLLPSTITVTVGCKRSNNSFKQPLCSWHFYHISEWEEFCHTPADLQPAGEGGAFQVTPAWMCTWVLQASSPGFIRCPADVGIFASPRRWIVAFEWWAAGTVRRRQGRPRRATWAWCDRSWPSVKKHVAMMTMNQGRRSREAYGLRILNQHQVSTSRQPEMEDTGTKLPNIRTSSTHAWQQGK